MADDGAGANTPRTRVRDVTVALAALALMMAKSRDGQSERRLAERKAT